MKELKDRVATDGTREKSCSVELSARLHDISDCITYLLVDSAVGWTNPFRHDANSSKAVLRKRQRLHFQRYIHRYTHTQPAPSPRTYTTALASLEERWKGEAARINLHSKSLKTR